MSQANSVSGDVITNKDSGALELRIFRAMTVSVLVAVIVSAVLAPWRVTFGLMLGGGLSLWNYHWLRTSVFAIFNLDPRTQRPRVKISRYIIRYFVVGIVVFGSYRLRMASLPVMIAGLCSFVPAFFIEAFRQFYFAIIHREESY